MKTHLLKIATVCLYGLAASPHDGSAPATAGVLAEMAARIAEAVNPGIDALAAVVRDLGASQSGMGSEPFPLANAVLWAAGTGFIVLAASWLGRSNLAPLR